MAKVAVRKAQHQGGRGTKAIVGRGKIALVEDSDDAQEQMLALIVNLVEDVTEIKRDVTEIKRDVAEVKQDVADAKQDVVNAKTEVKQDVVNAKAEVKQDVADAKAEIKEDIGRVKIGLGKLETNLRWVIYVGGGIAAMIGWALVRWIGAGF